MSKGSTGRPFSVSNEEYSNRWDAIFGKDNEKKNEAQNLESDRPDTAWNNRSSDNPEGQAGQTKDA
jgi:hypothetical protein